MKKIAFIAICCLTLSLTSCREEKKEAKPAVEEKSEVNIETPEGSIKTDGDNVDIKIEDN